MKKFITRRKLLLAAAIAAPALISPPRRLLARSMHGTGGGGGGGYTAKAIHASGDAALTLPVGGMIGIVRSPYGLLSFWALVNSNQSFTVLSNSNGDIPINIRWDTQALTASVDGSLYEFDQTNNIGFGTSVAPAQSTTWANFIFSWDMNHAPGSRVFQFALNGTVVAATTIERNDGTTAFNIDYPDFDMAAALSSDNFLTGDMADYYFTAPSAFFDLSNPANVAKFIAAGKPVSLGANGSTPTGVQPYVFFSRTGSNPAEFATNKGSGGPFTFSGTALTNATTSPSD